MVDYRDKGLPSRASGRNAAGCLPAFTDRRALDSVLPSGVPISRAVSGVPALADGPSRGFQKTPNCCFSNSFLGAVLGGTGRCSSLTLWRVRGPRWFCLWALNLVEFLLLWLVRDWLSLLSLVREAYPPTLFSLLICGWRRDFRGSLAGGLGGRVVIVVVSFPARFECELQESVAAVAGCMCFERGCWFARAAIGFVIGLRVRVSVSRRLREPMCGVAFIGAGLWSAEPVEGVLALLAVPFLLGEVRSQDCSGLVSAGCCATSELRYAAVVLAIAFWWVFPERRLGGSGGERLLTLWVEVVLRFVCTFLDCIGGTPFVPMVRCFASFLAPCVLSQMVVCQLCAFFLYFTWFLGTVVLCHGLGAVLRTVATFVAKASFRCVFPLVPHLCLEALVAVWCVALPTYGGRSGALCYVHLRANVIVALLKLLGFGAGVACAALFGLRLLVCGFWQVVCFVLSGAWMDCVVPLVAPGACVGTVCSAVCPDRCPIGGTPGVGPALCLSFALSLGSEGTWLGYPVSHSLCGRVVVVTTGKSRHDGGARCDNRTDLSGCRGALDGHILVAVVAAVAISVWGTPGFGIPAVGLPADAVTAEHVATSDKVSPQSDVTLSQRGSVVATSFPVATKRLSRWT
ncbi:hypothetical protein Taro_030975 [Colocasia esculenta]|uniref:Uncharacterized protein n=1 Tax=Colocasia esculenta TaxID=4460 RepID=A0A843VNT4_COLES|nr:hypothetical protein [Colocasia esculenta]